MSHKKPTELKLLEGNKGHQSKELLRPGPAYPDSYGKPPSFLKGEGRKLWKNLVPQLELVNMKANVYRSSLIGLCNAYNTAVECEKIIQKKGRTYETPVNGCTVKRPEVDMAFKAWQQVRMYSIEFGFTPASRSRIQIPQPKKKTMKEMLA